MTSPTISPATAAFVFVAPDLAPSRLAGYLRGAADALAPCEAPL